MICFILQYLKQVKVKNLEFGVHNGRVYLCMESKEGGVGRRKNKLEDREEKRVM